VTAASDLTDGRWRASWGDWEILLDSQHDRWTATVERHAGICLERGGFLSATDAVAWAAQKMTKAGVVVFIVDAPQMRIESALSFEPVLV
jgi:hypothetical protein